MVVVSILQTCGVIKNRYPIPPCKNICLKYVNKMKQNDQTKIDVKIAQNMDKGKQCKKMMKLES